MANSGFRYFDPDVAESITVTGQYFLRSIDERINQRLNDVFQTKNHQYCTYQDTDSVYFDMSAVVDKYLANLPQDKIVKALETIAVDKLQTEINAIVKDCAEALNLYSNEIFFKLEAVASVGIWKGKKMYALKVHSSEGVTYSKPKFKTMGLEMVRSSTPHVIREALRESLTYIFDGTEKDVQQFIAEEHDKFMKLGIREVAFPRTANNMADYADPRTIYRSGCPIHVRGSLIYNEMVKKADLSAKYPLIGEGDKIKFCYLKMPNPARENIIAFPADGIIPPELKLDSYVDYEMQFEKGFLSAMEGLLEPLGWSIKEEVDMSSFFG